jgi:MoaA/NifB/PqqE/SkfB family radical SAM enzyme
MFKEKTIDDWLETFSRFDRNLIIMFSGLGEPSLDKKLVEFVKRLDKLDNCIGIVLWTNASIPEILNQYLSCQKVYFYASYHREHLTVDEFLNNISKLVKYGKVAKVSYVVKKETTIELVRSIAKQIDAAGVPWFHVTADRRDWLADKEHFTAILSDFHVGKSLDYNLANRKTRGVPCMVGRDYIIIESNGNVWPCLAWRYYKSFCLGNIFEDFKPRALPLICFFRNCTGCIQEYTQIVGSGLSSNIWGITTHRAVVPDSVLRFMTFPLIFVKARTLIKLLKIKITRS